MVHSAQSLAQLIHSLGKTKPEQNDQPRTVFLRFLQALPTPLPARYGTHLFRLLFPYFMPRRRYQMKETVLARRLAQTMGLNKIQAGFLYGWDDGQEGGRGSAGCLGDEIQRVARNMLSIRVGSGSLATTLSGLIPQYFDR